MTAPRLHVAELPSAPGQIRLGPAVLRHARVIRLKAGDILELFDGRGRSADATVLSTGSDGLCCELRAFRSDTDPVPRLVLVQVLPKSGKLDDIVRMVTEVGVSEIRLATTARSTPAPKPDRLAARLDRLQRIMLEAVRQCRRSHVPELFAPAPLEEVVLEAEPGAIRLACYEGADARLAADLPGDAAWLVVGPEGGLGPEDMATLVGSGYAPVSLGPSVLRVETAAPVAAALVLDRLWAASARS